MHSNRQREIGAQRNSLKPTQQEGRCKELFSSTASCNFQSRNLELAFSEPNVYHAPETFLPAIKRNLQRTRCFIKEYSPSLIKSLVKSSRRKSPACKWAQVTHPALITISCTAKQIALIKKTQQKTLTKSRDSGLSFPHSYNLNFLNVECVRQSHLVEDANLNLKKKNSLKGEGRREFSSFMKKHDSLWSLRVSGESEHWVGAARWIVRAWAVLGQRKLQTYSRHKVYLNMYLQNLLVPMSGCKAWLPIP